MKIKFLLGAAVVSLLAFNSCKKDDKTNPSNGNQGSSKKLKKVTKTAGAVVTVYNLAYDGSNHLLSYRSSDNSEYVLFSYDAQGNLTGIEQKEEEFKNSYSYTYQGNLPASGIFKSWRQVAGQPDELVEDDRLTYTVSNNKVTKMKLEMLQTSSEVNLQLTYAGANLVKVTSDGPFSYTADFNFGTHRSAFPKVSNYVLDQAGFSLQFASNNEMLSASYDFPGTGSDLSINTQYTYDSDGYVLTSNDGSEQMVFEYE
jgi:YD repeat-containing protein